MLRDLELPDAATTAEVRAMLLAKAGLLVVVWHADEGRYGRLGYKPWYAVSSGAHPRTLHVLWLDGVLRCEPRGALFLSGDSGLVIARARLSAAGQRYLAAINKYNRNLPT